MELTKEQREENRKKYAYLKCIYCKKTLACAEKSKYPIDYDFSKIRGFHAVCGPQFDPSLYSKEDLKQVVDFQKRCT